MIKKIRMKLRTTGEHGIFHNTRNDVRSLAEVCSGLTDKINELIDKVNELDRDKQEG